MMKDAGPLAIAVLAAVAFSGAMLSGGATAARSVVLVASALTIALALVVRRAIDRERRTARTIQDDAQRSRDELSSALARARESEQVKDEFVSSIVHELRDPMSPILIWTQLLRSGSLDREKTHAALDTIERSISAQARLIEDLLTLARAASGELRVALAPIHLAPVVRLVAESHRAACAAKQIGLQVHADVRADLVSGDAEPLGQMLSALIVHAIATTPEGGDLTIDLRRTDAWLELDVCDTGSGMTPHSITTAFMPYRRNETGLPSRKGRLALGMAAAAHIVRLHGGLITAHSDGPGLGTTITLQLPCLASTPTTAEFTTAVVMEVPRTGERQCQPSIRSAPSSSPSPSL